MKIAFGILASLAAIFAPATAIAQVTGQWFTLTPGVLGQWCWDTCIDQSDLPPNSQGLGLIVWCRDIDCGMVSGTVGFYRDGLQLETDADLTELGKGDKGVLTFTTTNQRVTGLKLQRFSHYGN